MTHKLKIATAIAIGFSSIASLAFAKGPGADDGMTSAFHKQNVGKMVFSKSKIVVGREQPGQFTDKFKISDPIYWRVYAAQSGGNALASEGLGCTMGYESDIVYEYDLSVDGVPKNPTNSWSVSKPLRQAQLDKQTTWSDEGSLTNALRSDVTVGSQFLADVLPELKPGTHKFDFTVKVKCADGSHRRTKPLATGSFTADMTAGSIADATAPKNVLPKAVKSDPAFAAKATQIMNQEWKAHGEGRVALKTVLTQANWEVERNDLTGIIISRSLPTVVAYKDDGGCHYYAVRFRQDAQGRGKFGPTYFGSEELGEEPIQCSRVK